MCKQTSCLMFIQVFYGLKRCAKRRKSLLLDLPGLEARTKKTLLSRYWLLAEGSLENHEKYYWTSDKRQCCDSSNLNKLLQIVWTCLVLIQTSNRIWKFMICSTFQLKFWNFKENNWRKAFFKAWNFVQKALMLFD